VAPWTGLIGYPSVSGNRVALAMEFNPSLELGSLFEVRGSALQVANGIWNVYSVTHHLDSETPGGQWFSQIEASKQTA
jgi:hypothetical protein